MTAAAARSAARTAARVAPARPAPRKIPAGRPERTNRSAGRRAASRHSVRGGVVWILAIAVLLAGVVAVNVAGLRQNMQLESLTLKRTALIDRNLTLLSELSSALSPTRVDGAAQAGGMVKASSDETTYISLGAGGK